MLPLRKELTEEHFREIVVHASGYGEPGFVLVDDECRREPILARK